MAREDQVSSDKSLGVADNTSKRKARKVSSNQSDVAASEVSSTRQTKKRVKKDNTKDTSVDIIVKQAEITLGLSAESNDIKGASVFSVWLFCTLPYSTSLLCFVSVLNDE